MSDAEKLITRLVLRAVDGMPMAERPQYYRALASLSSDDALVPELAAMADSIDAFARRQQQLELKLSIDNRGGGVN